MTGKCQRPQSSPGLLVPEALARCYLDNSSDLFTATVNQPSCQALYGNSHSNLSRYFRWLALALFPFSSGKALVLRASTSPLSSHSWQTAALGHSLGPLAAKSGSPAGGAVSQPGRCAGPFVSCT